MIKALRFLPLVEMTRKKMSCTEAMFITVKICRLIFNGVSKIGFLEFGTGSVLCK